MKIPIAHMPRGIKLAGDHALQLLSDAEILVSKESYNNAMVLPR